MGENNAGAPGVIARIAEVAEAIGWQANVGAMETAGSIVSYLARFPDQIEPFLSGESSPMDWPRGWHTLGSLTWHGQDGKIHRPEDVRRHVLIKKMERGA